MDADEVASKLRVAWSEGEHSYNRLKERREMTRARVVEARIDSRLPAEPENNRLVSGPVVGWVRPR